MTTKTQILLSITDDDLVIIEGRTRQRVKTKVVKKDADVNTNVGEAIMSFAPVPQQQRQ